METLGEYLSAVRSELGLTLEEVSQSTGVYEKFIHYIETGKYHLLPPGVYVLGFLKKLAGVYNISCEALVEQYRKELGIVEHAASTKLAEQKTWKAWWSKITITPKLITITSSVAVGVFAFFYIVFQVFAINKTPALAITEPKNDAVIAGTSINVAGKTEPGITVTINGENVFVDTNGDFHTTIGVAPGQKELRIEASNKFGKKAEQILAMRVDDAPVAQVAGAETNVPSELLLELKFAKATKIQVNQDGTNMPAEIIPAGATKQISANDKVTLTTYDAGNTQATLNGKAIGLLGKVGEKVTIPFSKDAVSLVGQSNSNSNKNSNSNANSANK
ncbi:MAG TPA: RodZ domain-containing protein [Patescibacteria group bacterium]|nr:RodZ domain-containing protein [Patescibacteria group bacterium]